MSMPKVLQINSTANWGSTGRIAEQIGCVAMKRGWDSYIAYGRYKNPSQSNLIKIGNRLSVLLHYIEHKLFDNDGLSSRFATRNLIKQIERISPDVVHLHNIHDHWLNYEVLFEYLNRSAIPVVWTQHDCWAFTGGCPYYMRSDCEKWQYECSSCKHKATLIDRTRRQFIKKKNLFTANSKMRLVTVSKWLEGEVSKSFFSSHNITTIYNGIDLRVFSQDSKIDVKEHYNIRGKKLLIALATTWSTRKGFDDYIELSKRLGQDYMIMLVGLTKDKISSLPPNVIGIRRTSNIEELVALYASADVLLNLSYEETFGLTTVEALACGTPAVVYDSTASPELVTPQTGIVVKPGDIDGVLNAIEQIVMKGKACYGRACRERAEKYFDKDLSFQKYVDLYEETLDSN